MNGGGRPAGGRIVRDERVGIALRGIEESGRWVIDDARGNGPNAGGGHGILGRNGQAEIHLIEGALRRGGGNIEGGDNGQARSVGAAVGIDGYGDRFLIGGGGERREGTDGGSLQRSHVNDGSGVAAFVDDDREAGFLFDSHAFRIFPDTDVGHNFRAVGQVQDGCGPVCLIADDGVTEARDGRHAGRSIARGDRGEGGKGGVRIEADERHLRTPGFGDHRVIFLAADQVVDNGHRARSGVDPSAGRYRNGLDHAEVHHVGVRAVRVGDVHAEIARTGEDVLRAVGGRDGDVEFVRLGTRVAHIGRRQRHAIEADHRRTVEAAAENLDAADGLRQSRGVDEHGLRQRGGHYRAVIGIDGRRGHTFNLQRLNGAEIKRGDRAAAGIDG